MADSTPDDEPTYVISVAARLVNMHPQTLRYYERAGLVHPTRSRGRIRLYSQRDVDRLRKISRLTDELGVNLAGVEVILRLTERLEQVQEELEKHQVRLSSDYTIEEQEVAGAEPAPDGRRSYGRAVQTTTRPTSRPRRNK